MTDAAIAARGKRPTNSETSRTRAKVTPRTIALPGLDLAPRSANAYWISVSVAPAETSGRQRRTAPTTQTLPATAATPANPDVGCIATGTAANTRIGISARARIIQPEPVVVATGLHAPARARSARW